MAGIWEGGLEKGFCEDWNFGERPKEGPGCVIITQTEAPASRKRETLFPGNPQAGSRAEARED